MAETNRDILTEKQLQLEVEFVINKQLYNKNIIDKATYENVSVDILKAIKNESKNKD